jgi:hypothetical protein
MKKFTNRRDHVAKENIGNKLVALQIILLSIKALDPDTEQNIVDKLAQFPDLKLLYVNILFKKQKNIKKETIESDIKKLVLILQKNCNNQEIKNQLQIYKTIIHSNKILKIPTTTYQNYFGLLQYIKKFIYYYELVEYSVPENEAKIKALQGLIILEAFIE